MKCCNEASPKQRLTPSKLLSCSFNIQMDILGQQEAFLHAVIQRPGSFWLLALPYLGLCHLCGQPGLPRFTAAEAAANTAKAHFCF